MPCSAFFATLKFDSLCNVRIANSWSRAPQMCQFGASSFSSTSTLYLPQFIHWRGISWFSKTKSSGRVEQQCTMWGLPLWLHLHILQESSNTNELISYFTELSRSTMAFPPCQPQVWQKTKIRKELKSKTNVLGAWLNSSLSLTFTTPHSSSHSSTEVCVWAVQSSSHSPYLLPSCTGRRRRRRGIRREAREWFMRPRKEAVSAPLAEPQHQA